MNTSGVTINPSLTHSDGSENSMLKFKVISPARNSPACLADSSPVVSGLALVLSTCLSISRSAKSLMIQPAERHESAPTVNRDHKYKFGIMVGEERARPQ